MTATAPFRLRVLQALTEQLETIQRTADPDNGIPGYDLSGNVFRGRSAFGKNDPSTMLSILEDPKQLMEDEATPQQSDAARTNYDLILQGFIPDDKANPTDPAHYLRDDVKAKLYAIKDAGSGFGKHNTILGFGPQKPCVAEMHIGSGVVRPPDHEVSDKAWFFLPVRLCLVEDGANAFT
jgi:hypothetical protein